jgi:hypothetical protein
MMYGLSVSIFDKGEYTMREQDKALAHLVGEMWNGENTEWFVDIIIEALENTSQKRGVRKEFADAYYKNHKVTKKGMENLKKKLNTAFKKLDETIDDISKHKGVRFLDDDE